MLVTGNKSTDSWCDKPTNADPLSDSASGMVATRGGVRRCWGDNDDFLKKDMVQEEGSRR